VQQYETGSTKQIKSQILESTKKWEQNRSLYGPSHYMEYNHNCVGNPNYTRKMNKKYAYMWEIVAMIKKKEHVFINYQENKQFSALGFGRNQTLFDNFILSFLFFSYLRVGNGKQC